jgi:PAS domain S-box-containing protein
MEKLPIETPREPVDWDFAQALFASHGRLLEMIAHGDPLERILEELARAMEHLSEGMIASVLLLDAASGRAHHGAAPNLPQEYWRAIDGLRIGPAVGSCGTAMYTGRHVVVSDIASDPLWDDYRTPALRHGLRACWSAPIFGRTGNVLGAFAMYYREVRSPTERDRRIVEAATHLAAIAIEADASRRALQQSESGLRAVLNHSLAAVYLKDVDGHHMFVNRAFEQITGIPESAALGRTAHELFERAFADAYAANDGLVLQSRQATVFEEEAPQSDGTHTYLSVKFPLLDADGTPYALCGMTTDITSRKRAERELERSREELRALTARLHSVREEERARMSREIHDELGQMLTVLSMSQSQLIASLRGGGDAPPREALAAQLESMQKFVTTALASVRRIATELRPDVLDALGLAAALEWQAAEFTRHTGIRCEVSLPSVAMDVASERATALFRIFQETLTNVARHSGACGVRARLELSAGIVELTVADDGRGMQPEAARGGIGSLGLLGMRERAAMLGGEMRVASAPGKGTTVTVRLPAGR